MTRGGEFSWIERYLAPLSGEGAFSLNDDAAILNTGTTGQLLVTQDALHEGVHFLKSDPVFTIAQKALRVNVSDVVAKGARPFAYSLALGVPDAWQDEDMAAFAKGLAHDQDFYGVSLTGGDTFRAPGGLCIAVTMFGTFASHAYVKRSGAKAGQVLLVTGTIGDGALGLKVAQDELKLSRDYDSYLLSRYRVPEPPIRIRDIVGRYATASMDISDGLVGDCRKLLQTSGVAGQIERELVPLSAPARRALADDPTLWDVVCGGGDDYQTLFSVDRSDVDRCLAKGRAEGVTITQIGEVRDGTSGALALMDQGVPVSVSLESFRHF